MRLLERRVERLEKDAGGSGGTILLVVDQAEGWLARNRIAPGVHLIIIHTGIERGPGE